MAQETWTKETFWAELDKLGEEKVRERIVAKAYGEAGHKRAFAEDWLRNREASRLAAAENRRNTTQTIAAIAAIVAATAATIGAIASILSLLWK